MAERAISANQFANFRKWVRNYPEADQWVADLSRPGRLTAALNWYRANLFGMLFGRHPRCPVPVMGVWSSKDLALAESQLKESRRYVDNEWRYERLEGFSHWIPLEAPDVLGALILDFVSADPGPDLRAGREA